MSSEYNFFQQRLEFVRGKFYTHVRVDMGEDEVCCNATLTSRPPIPILLNSVNGDVRDCNFRDETAEALLQQLGAARQRVVNGLLQPLGARLSALS